MTSSVGAVDADRAVKTKHRAMWASGDYPAVVSDLISELGPILVRACGVGKGEHVLDVAAGTGNAAIPAAVAGAHVVASDLTPELFEPGRRQAEAQHATLDWREADAEALPFIDGLFDVVMSCLGVMFAPHHQQSADELTRVCRSGGRIGLLSWTPEGFVGQLFATMKPYAPPPPPGARPPPLWGTEDHVRTLLGARIADVDARRQRLRIDHFATPEAFRSYFKSCYGPTVAVYRTLADDPDRAAELDHDLDDLARRFDIGSGSTVMEWEYLLFTARRV